MKPPPLFAPFVRELCSLMEQCSALGVKGCHLKAADHYLLGKIEEQTGGEAVELWAEADQITVVYSQHHWHLSGRDPFSPGPPPSLEEICTEVKRIFSPL